jgi:hypothetical protein
MSDLYRRYEVNEDMPVRFVGIHPVRWQPEWGTPQAMFAEAENADLLAAARQLPEVKALVKALQPLHSPGRIALTVEDIVIILDALEPLEVEP